MDHMTIFAKKGVQTVFEGTDEELYQEVVLVLKSFYTVVKKSVGEDKANEVFVQLGKDATAPSNVAEKEIS